MQSLDTIIKERLPLTNYQENMIIFLLAQGCRDETKRRIKSIVKYSFYSSFEGRWFSRRIYISDNEVQFHAGQDMREELRSIRKELLK